MGNLNCERLKHMKIFFNGMNEHASDDLVELFSRYQVHTDQNERGVILPLLGTLKSR